MGNKVGKTSLKTKLEESGNSPSTFNTQIIPRLDTPPPFSSQIILHVDALPSSEYQTIPHTGAQTSTEAINQLPPEILSRIFVIGEEEERIIRRSGKASHLTFPALVTQVCSRWRDIAISSPALWTHIHITRPPPHDLAFLYLRRAGPVTMLDIDVEMCSEDWMEPYIRSDDWVRQAIPMSRLVELLILRGARISRWRSLSLSVNRLAVFFRMLSLLNTYSAPALRSLCIEYNTDSPGHAIAERTDYAYSFGESYSVSGPALPNLSLVRFVSVPWDYVFNRPLPLLTGLTSLSLKASSELSSLSKLQELLNANPLLESLSLDSGDVLDWTISVGPVQCVQLPRLRSFTIRDRLGPWILDVMQMIEAPELERFAFAAIPQVWMGSPNLLGDTFTRILKYMSTGNAQPHKVDESGAIPAKKPIYPVLRELDISTFESPHEELITMLASYPSVIRLRIAGCNAELLGRSPWVLPNLTFLRFRGAISPQLGNILRRRADAGFPVRVVELPRSPGPQFAGRLPSTVIIKRYDPHLESND